MLSDVSLEAAAELLVVALQIELEVQSQAARIPVRRADRRHDAFADARDDRLLAGTADDQDTRVHLALLHARMGNRDDALAERDMLMLERSILSGLVESAAIRLPRYGSMDVRLERTVDVPQIQQRIDVLSRRYRELDTRIQELNWQTELIE